LITEGLDLSLIFLDSCVLIKLTATLIATQIHWLECLVFSERFYPIFHHQIPKLLTLLQWHHLFKRHLVFTTRLIDVLLAVISSQLIDSAEWFRTHLSVCLLEILFNIRSYCHEIFLLRICFWIDRRIPR
jgi:hypothetical protein